MQIRFGTTPAPPVTPAAVDTRQQSFGVGNATWVGTPRILSWKPMATVYDNFLSAEECDYLLNISRPLMEPAMLVNSSIQKHRRSKSRTSHGAFHDSFGDPVLAMITHRIGHVARVPPGAAPLVLARCCQRHLAPEQVHAIAMRSTRSTTTGTACCSSSSL